MIFIKNKSVVIHFQVDEFQSYVAIFDFLYILGFLVIHRQIVNVILQQSTLNSDLKDGGVFDLFSTQAQPIRVAVKQNSFMLEFET